MKTQFLPPIKRYMNAIERRLRLPWRERARVMSDLMSTVSARHEAGESYEEIMEEMGTPQQVADQFNREMTAPAGSRLRFLFLGLLVLLVLGCLVQAVYWNGFASGLSRLISSEEVQIQVTQQENASIGIIGGAGGPTAIFVASKQPHLLDLLTFSPLGTGLALAGAYLLARAGRGGSPRIYRLSALLGGGGLAVFLWGFGWQVHTLLGAGAATLWGILSLFLSPAFWLSLGVLIVALRRRHPRS